MDYATSSTHPTLCWFYFLSSLHEYDVCSMAVFFCDKQWMRLSKKQQRYSLYNRRVRFKLSWIELKKESSDKHANWNCHWSAASSIYSIFFSSFNWISVSVSKWAIKITINIMFVFFLQLFFAHFDKITIFNYSFNKAIIHTNRGVKIKDFSIKSRLSIINGQSAVMQNDNFCNLPSQCALLFTIRIKEKK